jgi:Tfp pilus assembly protein PilF
MLSFLPKIWEILLPIPMPWQVVLVIFLVLPFFPWLILRCLPWLTLQGFKIFLFLSEVIVQVFCFFEYQIAQAIRRSKRKLPGGIYAFSDFLAAIIRFFQSVKIKTGRIHTKLSNVPWILHPKWLYTLPLILLPVWFIRPHLGDSVLSTAIDGSVSWWCSLEHWAMTGEWKPSSLSCRYPNSSPRWDTPFKSKEYKYKREIQEYTRRITSSSGDAKAYYERGSSYLRIEEFEAAFKDYTESIRIDSKFSLGYVGRGRIYHIKGDKDAALKQYSTAIKVNPNSPSAYVARGGVYLEMNNNSAAFSDYSNSVRLDPKYASGYVGRGNVYQRAGDKDAALSEYKKSIQIDPSYAIAYVQLGNLYYQNFGNREAAVKEYERAVEVFLRNGEAQRHNEALRVLIALNNHKIHVVQSGESLSKIAKNYGIPMQEIISANRETFPSLVTNPDNIDTGWKLKIPQ